MLEKCTRWYPLLGRILVGGMFVLAGFQKATGYEGTVTFIGAAGLPVPELLAILVIALEILGGLALIVGWHTKMAATVLGVFVVAASLIYHADFADMMQSTLFLKNMAIVGALAYMAAYGAGAYAKDK